MITSPSTRAIARSGSGDGARGASRTEPTTRDRILDVAEELIARDGFDQFQLKDVATRLETSPPAIFAHFKGREAVAREVARRVLLDVPPLRRSLDDPLRDLRLWVRRFVAHMVSRPSQLRILLADLAKGAAKSELDRETDLVTLASAEVESLLACGRRLGVFRRLRADAFAPQLLGALLAHVAWEGWDEHGEVILTVPLSRMQREAEELAVAIVRPLDGR
jgi:AcrR family transcriptional regulator